MDFIPTVCALWGISFVYGSLVIYEYEPDWRYIKVLDSLDTNSKFIIKGQSWPHQAWTQLMRIYLLWVIELVETIKASAYEDNDERSDC